MMNVCPTTQDIGGLGVWGHAPPGNVTIRGLLDHFYSKTKAKYAVLPVVTVVLYSSYKPSWSTCTTTPTKVIIGRLWIMHVHAKIVSHCQ